MMFHPEEDRAASEVEMEGHIVHTSPDQSLVLMLELKSKSLKILDAKNMLELYTIQGQPKDDGHA
jgi:hypothetical protein